MAEHYRPKIGRKRAGMYQGYYCGRCGAPGQSLVKRVHRTKTGICLPRPKIVAMLDEANSPEAMRKRKFVGNLKRGEAPESKTWEYEV